MTLNHVTVINPMQTRRAEQQLIVDGGIVTAVTGADPAEKTAFDNMYVLPGLIDMHAHYPSNLSVGVRESASLLFLASGVTTVRDTGSMGTNVATLRDRIRDGEFPGPRVFFCGPVIDGDPPSHPLTTPVSSPQEARALVDEIAKDPGVDCIKVYSRVSFETLNAVRAKATEHGLPLIGHLPVGIELAESGLDDAQHLYGIGEADRVTKFADVWAAWDRVTDQDIDAVVEDSLANEIAHTPTLVTFDRLSRVEALQRRPPSGPLPRFFTDVVWNLDRGFPAIMNLSSSDLETLADALPRMRSVVRAMYLADVQLHIGSDSFMPFVVPGESIHQEMAEFVKSGVPLEAAWAIATREAGQALRVPQLGTIDIGAPADLLVFREDPTLRLEALDSLAFVVADGRLYSRVQLDHALGLHAAHVDSWIYRTVMGPIIRALYAILR